MLEELKKKPEESRRRIALTTSIVVSLVIVSGWVFSRGYLTPSVTTEPVATESSNQNTNNVSSAFDQIKVQFNALKNSIASVLVPFITGIDVYNKGDSE